MITILEERATENGSIIIEVAFTDEDGSAISPDTMFWSLSYGGSIINGREDVEISSPSSTEEILLHGDDLAVGSSVTKDIILTLEGTYSSPTHGSGVELVGQCKIHVDGLKS